MTRTLRNVAFACALAPILAGCQEPADGPLTRAMAASGGAVVALSGIADNAATVFAFVAPDCPLSQNHTLTLNTLADRFEEDSIAFFGVVAGEWYDDSEVAGFVTTYELAFPVLLDRDFALTDHFGARVTPEVFVVDAQGDLAYSGAIDNWVTELGQHRTVTTQHYLGDALRSLAAGRGVDVLSTRAVGCFIEREG